MLRFLCLCYRADVPLSPCVRTDALTPVGGDCGKGVSLSEGVLYSSLFPSSRHHGPLLLQSSGPARRSRTGSRYFSLLSMRHLLSSFSQPYNPSPSVPLTLISVLPRGLPPVNVTVVVSCHAAISAPPFWLHGQGRRNFSRAQRYSVTPC